MKLVSEYLKDAAKFRAMANSEENPELKTALENQAAAYQKLAIERAKKLGIPPPELPPKSNRNTHQS
jgi:hypothetical protein